MPRDPIPEVPPGVPAAFHRPPLAAALAAVRAAWDAAREAAWAHGAATYPALDAAVDALADAARAQRLLVMDLFQALDALFPCLPHDPGGDADRAWDEVRAHVGGRLLGRYYAQG